MRLQSFLLLCFCSLVSSHSRSFLKHLPEEKLTTPELIAYWGYPCEVHEATTKDGYILELHRIPHGISSSAAEVNSIDSPKPLFFLQHGLLGSSSDWVTNLPDQSLAFLLADAGFDVWLGNVRGNFYSSRHTQLLRSNSRYWEFSWDEMAALDLPAMVDKALEVNGSPYLYYVGHSQGTEIMFGRLGWPNGSSEFSKKIRKFFALAPVGAVGHVRGLMAWLGRLFGHHPRALQLLFGTRDFLPHNWLSTLFAQLVCGQRWENPLCDNILFQLGGPESAQFNQSRLLVYMEHTPAGTSSRNIYHWAQMQQSGRMQMFNFGSERSNVEHYGQPSPPLYQLKNVNVPVYFYYSDDDWLADTRDVEEILLGQIPPQWVKLRRKLNQFNHLDFIWGLRAPGQIYTQIIRTVKQHERAIKGK